MSRTRTLRACAALAVLALACADGERRAAPGAPARPGARPSGAATRARHAPGEPGGPAFTPSGRTVLLYQDGAASEIDEAEAEAMGATVIDLSDGWAPYVLQDATPGMDDARPNEYRRTFLALASDAEHADLGDYLTEGEENYLEVFGIPPTLTVLRRRWLAEADRPCFAEVDTAAIARLARDIPYTTNAAGKTRLERSEALDRRVRALLRKHGTDDPGALPAAYEALVREWRDRVAVRDAILAAQKRLACEGLFPGRGYHRPGVMDWSTHIALGRFERKNMIYGWGFLGEETVAALARPPLDLHHDALLRALRERVVDAAGVIEDGSAPGTPDLVGAFSAAAARALGVERPDGLRAFWERHPDPADLRVAVRLPDRPRYHQERMLFAAEIDRGDVWYDFPFRADGSEIEFPRESRPTLAVYARHGGERVPLVRWRTTIGSWRSELRDGVEHYKYKNSDVGPRVWRHIVAAPVWIPPAVTPTRDLVMERRVEVKPRRFEQVEMVNTDVIGPGFQSAYGMVMAIHVEPRRHRDGTVTWFDNQIRTHGSADYNSILRRYSHGCHRLHNHLAVRLFSFLLRHVEFERQGPRPLGWALDFTHEGVRYQHRLASRGYYYQLADPIPIEVLEGNIKGKVKEPIEAYVRKPSGSAGTAAPSAAVPAESVPAEGAAAGNPAEAAEGNAAEVLDPEDARAMGGE